MIGAVLVCGQTPLILSGGLDLQLYLDISSESLPPKVVTYLPPLWVLDTTLWRKNMDES